MCPVVESPQLVEGDVTNESVALVIEGDRHVAGHTIVLRINPISQLPGVASVPRISGFRIVLKYPDDLLRIRRIHCDARFREITRRGSESEDLGVRSFWEILTPQEHGCSEKKNNDRRGCESAKILREEHLEPRVFAIKCVRDRVCAAKKGSQNTGPRLQQFLRLPRSAPSIVEFRRRADSRTNSEGGS